MTSPTRVPIPGRSDHPTPPSAQRRWHRRPPAPPNLTPTRKGGPWGAILLALILGAVIGFALASGAPIEGVP